MAESRPSRSQWPAFLAGALVVVVLVLAWTAWRATQDAGSRVDLSLRAPRPSELPLPRLPDAPRLPNAPIPVPK